MTKDSRPAIQALCEQIAENAGLEFNGLYNGCARFFLLAEDGNKGMALVPLSRQLDNHDRSIVEKLIYDALLSSIVALAKTDRPRKKPRAYRKRLKAKREAP